MDPKHYRFFVSYRSKDEATAKVIVHTLTTLGHYVKDMMQLDLGVNFPEQIRQWIDWCHFVVPVITKQSRNRPWVHQEIGYALGRHVPLVPIVCGCPPGSLAFLGNVQAIVVNDKSDLPARLSTTAWKNSIDDIKHRNPFPVSACDIDAESRSRLFAEVGDKIAQEFPEAPIRIRQCSRLTSFSVPRNPAAPPWTLVNLKNLFWLQAKERIALESLVDEGGCDLMIDPDYYEFADGRNRLCQPPAPKSKKIRDGYDPYIQLARLATLRDFLQIKNDDLVRVVVVDNSTSSESMTIIGDHWLTFSAAGVPFETLRKTIWTWHAPTVGWELEIFDRNFTNALEGQQNKIGDKKTSRVYAIERINEAIAEIEREFKIKAHKTDSAVWAANVAED